MSYLILGKMARDPALLDRVTACAVLEGVTGADQWVRENAWLLSAQPGWVDAYKYAIDSGDDQPGANEGAVTDGMILSAVQTLLGVIPVEPDEEEDEEEPE